MNVTREFYSKCACVILCKVSAVLYTFRSYILPFVSTKTNDTDTLIIKTSSLLTTFPMGDYVTFSKSTNVCISVHGTWGSKIRMLHEHIWFDDTGFLSIYFPPIVPYTLSIFATHVFGKLLLIVDSETIIPLGNHPVQIPHNPKSLCLVYNINPILQPFLRPILSVRLERCKESGQD